MNFSVTAMQIVKFLGSYNGLKTNVNNSWNFLDIAGMYPVYTHNVHDFEIHIFADEVDQVDHHMINGLCFSFQYKSLYCEYNTVR